MRVTLLIAVLGCLVFTAGANELRPRAIVSYESRDSGQSSTTYLREELEVLMTRTLSDALSVRFRLAGSHYDSDSLFDDEVLSSTRVLELRPSGAVIFDLGPVKSEAEYMLRDSSFETVRDDYSSANEIIRWDTSWIGSRFLPSGSVRATRYRLSDDRFGEGLTNDAVHGVLSESWGGLSASAGANYRLDQDDRLGFERTTLDRLASLSYADSFGGGRVTFSAGASGMLTDIEDSAGSRTTRIPNYQPVSRALWGIDETPLESLDRPLISVPALIDNRFDVLTEISLGPESSSFQNIAFDLGGISQVEQIEISVRDEKRDFVLDASGVIWEVYTSTDGERWTPHSADLEVTFNPARSQYEISFARVEVRWIKVVSFGVAPQQVFVTETRVLFVTTLTMGARDSRYENVALTTALTVMPHRLVRLSYTGAGWYVSQQFGIEEATETRDLTQTFSAHYDPHPRAGFDARVELRDATTGELDEDLLAYSLGTRLTPIRRLQVSLFCELREEERLAGPIDGQICAASGSAQVLPTLDVTLGVSQRQEEYTKTGGTVTTDNYYLGATARLTRSLRMTVSGTASEVGVEGTVDTFIPPSTDRRIYADFDYRAGNALGLGVTLGWVDGEAISGLTQRYRVRWNPFGSGAITLTTSYNQDIDPYTDSQSRRLFISPRWQINRLASLTIGYSMISLEGQQSFESDSIHSSLSLFR